MRIPELKREQLIAFNRDMRLDEALRLREDASIAAYNRAYRESHRRAARSFTDDTEKLLMRVGGGASFDPSELSKVTGWLALEDESGGTIADRIQSTTATVNGGAVRSTNANGLEQLTLDGINDWIAWGLTAAMNSGTFWGFAGWFNVTNPTSGSQMYAGHFGSGHTTRVFWRAEPGNFSRIYNGGQVQNVNAPDNATATWQWVCATIDTSQSGPGSDNLDRVRVYYDTTQQVITSTNAGGADTVPSTLGTEVSVAGKVLGIGSDSVGGNRMTGRVGPNIYFLGGGHLTAEENENLRDFESMAGAS